MNTFSPRNLTRFATTLGLAGAIAAMGAGSAYAGTGPIGAHGARPAVPCTYLLVDKQVTDHESDFDVDTGVQIKNHDFVHMSASGSIWAGVRFTGTNGPAGWTGWHAGNDFPLPGQPPFSQLAKTAEDEYRYVGTGQSWEYLNDSLGSGQTRLSVRINDDVPGNGNGAFTVSLQVYRPCGS